MVKAILLVLLTTSLFGQISLAPSPNVLWSCSGLNCAVTQREAGHAPYPLLITVTGTGTINLGSCIGSACGRIVPRICTQNVQPCSPTSTAPASLYFILDEFANTFPAGAYTGSIQVTGGSGGSGTVNISVVSIAYTNPIFTSLGTINGCTLGGPGTWFNPGDLSICTISPPYDGSFTMPVPPNTYRDQDFGGIVKALVNPNPERAVGADSVTGQINSDNSLVITNSLVDGQIYATSTATGADIYSGFQAGAFSWDPDDPLTYYYLTFAQRVIRKHNLATNADSLVYSYPGAAFDLSNGGDGSVNKLKYWCVFTQGSDPTHPLTGHDQTVMIVNLNTGNSYAGSYAGSLIEVGGYNARLCTLSKGVDTVTHKMYAYLASYPGAASELYSLQFANDNATVLGTSLVDEGPLGQGETAFLTAFGQNIYNGPACDALTASHSLCKSATHEDTFEAPDGQQYLLTIYGTISGWATVGYSYSAFMRFNAGPSLMLVDVEAGGGLVEGFNICANGNCGDVHEGCALKAPVCVVGTDGDPAMPAWNITSASTSGGNINLSLDAAPSIATGDSVMVNGVAGCTNANGVTNNVGVSGTTVILTGKTCNAPWSRSVNGAGILKNVGPAADPGHQDELMLFDFSQINQRTLKAVRLAKTRSVSLNNQTDSYYTQNHPAISMDGSLVVFQSNNRIPYNVGVFSIATGYSPAPPCSYTLSVASLNLGSTASSGTVSVIPTPSNCPVTAISNVPWATASVSGNTVNWAVTANTNPQSRSGSLNVAGQTVPISQSASANSLTMLLFPNSLTFETNDSEPQPVSLTFTGGPGPSWTATSSQSNITVSPTSGVGNGTLQIRVTPGSSGVVTVTAPGAANSPQAIQIQISSAPVSVPFGSFDTPINNSRGVSAAIAVTGWALDPIGITKVDIWREPVGYEPPGLVYIGDAVFVLGARPDVANSFPTYPRSNNAGWGYLLLTNFLPNANGARGPGNGTYNLHALAHNQAGAVVDLGTRSITVDNADATLPFGNIDTPAQGAAIFGNAYVNFGWALTPMPGVISTDGITITVNVDGITLGHPTYNQFRGDIATVFPGFANSNGAIGYFYIDTTKLTNGLHTISWNVWDNMIRGNGVGSRFFNVFNIATAPNVEVPQAGSLRFTDPVESSPKDASAQSAHRLAPVADEVLSMEVEEMALFQVPLGATSGYMVANGQRQPLPVGSTLQGGVFYWQLAPVFLGEYDMVFERPGAAPTHLRVVVRPKTYSAGEYQAVQ
jgi:hypothetical protein